MGANRLNITWHDRVLTKGDYLKRNGHQPLVLWFTGLSGSGKSTLAHAVEEELFRKGCYTYILDGDNIRHGLNSDLGFSEADRRENIRRIGEVAKLFVDAGIIVLAAFISPYREDRERVRALFEPAEFIEVFVNCDLAVCESRDPKGLYRKARSGELKQFTGIDSPYEVPFSPELVVNTACSTVKSGVQSVLAFVRDRGLINGD
ncbi:adenosine-5'-phosphosulfate 3'-kinase [Geotalea daltonii FRC-32]|uniref:Adenylyl-sulfate kinase n=1 Tax=Geotalea daltonii (strain DSM 22248 / JCM 15807 / FRC-32) TaxID=316067 RepID=CYSC_GEODF|nr:adenylyl-sulfate kinase [Geotalea daltonii]B9M543.1 RecName: Full=Adenylyl-sulfate kinase; AltName: Full=APS kinase; AltName: Full=ATP adenosine-5'-phosphosulfate 3'-phosphotransferase; AltName: Full=Adenosine-5'-phosphosulfate kinase [Geotalea daltonii FRC-32]ACM19798.1 adenosine-5'-phosphosulfate 3'-kinase [Geotalea daltonii FRC-32]